MQLNLSCFGERLLKFNFLKKINFFYVFWIVLIVYIKNKKNIILIYFEEKNILKNYSNPPSL